MSGLSIISCSDGLVNGASASEGTGANTPVLWSCKQGGIWGPLPWYDAPLWAYAEHYGLAEILSEDFEHGRRYGTVRVRNPFVDLE
jgi:hypothetical protein